MHLFKKPRLCYLEVAEVRQKYFYFFLAVTNSGNPRHQCLVSYRNRQLSVTDYRPKLSVIPHTMVLFHHKFKLFKIIITFHLDLVNSVRIRNITVITAKWLVNYAYGLFVTLLTAGLVDMHLNSTGTSDFLRLHIRLADKYQLV